MHRHLPSCYSFHFLYKEVLILLLDLIIMKQAKFASTYLANMLVKLIFFPIFVVHSYKKHHFGLNEIFFFTFGLFVYEEFELIFRVLSKFYSTLIKTENISACCWLLKLREEYFSHNDNPIMAVLFLLEFNCEIVKKILQVPHQRLFSKVGKFEGLSYSVSAKFDSGFSLCPASPIFTAFW